LISFPATTIRVQTRAPRKWLQTSGDFINRSRGKKFYLVGEFGFVPVAGVEKLLETVISEGLSGAMIWSLRYHNRDGGFYWHSEPASASVYNPYHYPGFPSGEVWNEIATLKLMRAKALEISGLTMPVPQPPVSPRLLPITSVARSHGKAQ